MKQRILVAQAVEAARTSEEQVVTDVREADVGSILGWGFAPIYRRHAVLHRHDGNEGVRRACAQKFEKKHGARFKPPKLLLDMADKNETFYGRFAPKTKAAASLRSPLTPAKAGVQGPNSSLWQRTGFPLPRE